MNASIQKSKNINFIYKVATSIILAVISCFGLVNLVTDMSAFSPIALFLLPAVAYFYYIDFTEKTKLGRLIAPKIFCVVLGLFTTFGMYFTTNYDAHFDCFFGCSGLAFITVLGLWIFFAKVYIFAVAEIVNKDFSCFNSPPKKRTFFILFVLFFIIWFFYFLLLYPGILTPDSYSQIHMADGTAPWRNHHPVLHTLIIKATMTLGGWSPALYSIIQMLVMSAAFAYVLYWLRGKQIWKWLWWVSAAYFAFHPIHAFNSVTMMKDVYFAAAVLLFTICIAEDIMSKGKYLKSAKGMILFIISGLLVMFLRNNGIFVFIPTAIILTIISKKRRLSIGIESALMTVAYFVVIGPVFSALGIGLSSVGEAVAIPFQQIAAVVASGKTLTAEQNTYISSILPLGTIVEKYNPAFFDPLKFDAAFNASVIASNIGHFFKIWFEILTKYPAMYIKAFLSETRFLWDPMQRAGMIQSFTESTYYTAIINKPLIPKLYDSTMTIINVSQFSRFAVFTRPIWNTAVYYTAFFLFAVVSIAKKRKAELVIWAPCFFVWISLIISTPVATSGRYAYSIFCTLPVIAMLSLGFRKKENASAGN